MADNVSRFAPRPQPQANPSTTGKKAVETEKGRKASAVPRAQTGEKGAAASSVDTTPKRSIKAMAKGLVGSLKAPTMLGNKKAAEKRAPWPAGNADFFEPANKAALQGVFDHALKLMDTHVGYGLHIVHSGLQNVDHFMTADSTLIHFTGSRAQVSHWLACELEAMASALSQSHGAIHEVAQALRREPLGQHELSDLAGKLPPGSPTARLDLMQEHARA